MKKRILCVALSLVLSLLSAIAVSAEENTAVVETETFTEEQLENIGEAVDREEISGDLEESEDANETEDIQEEKSVSSDETEDDVNEEDALAQGYEDSSVSQKIENEASGNGSISNITLSAVTNLKAVSSGKNKVQLSWNKVAGAEEYIIYRQIGNGSFSYRYITKNLTYLDMTASGLDYNFYRVYPCYTAADGKRIVGPSNSYVFAKAALNAVSNLKAVSVGKNQVKLTWSKVVEADGYLIYRQVGKGKYAYRSMTSNLSFADTTASDTEYNFYWVFPYYNQDSKMVPGAAPKYVFAKGVLPAVTGLKAQTTGKSIKLTWNKVSGAEGYLIYRQEGNGEFKYLYMKDASATSYVDSKCSGTDYNYYRVYPYHKNAGTIIPGLSDKYVYGILNLPTAPDKKYTEPQINPEIRNEYMISIEDTTRSFEIPNHYFMGFRSEYGVKSVVASDESMVNVSEPDPPYNPYFLVSANKKGIVKITAESYSGETVVFTVTIRDLKEGEGEEPTRPSSGGEPSNYSYIAYVQKTKRSFDVPIGSNVSFNSSYTSVTLSSCEVISGEALELINPRYNNTDYMAVKAGTSKVRAELDNGESAVFTITVRARTAEETYKSEFWEKWVRENITSDMSDYEKVRTAAQFIATHYDYVGKSDGSGKTSYGYDSLGEIDCWGSSALINGACEVMGISVIDRFAGEDLKLFGINYGQLSNHRNNFVWINGVKYLCDACPLGGTDEKHAIVAFFEWTYD